MMVRTTLASFFLLAALVVAMQAAEKKPAPKDDAKQASLDRFKQLAGDWTGKMSEGDGKEPIDVTVNYKVTSGGHAVMETLGPGSEHEMITVIHPDGDDLVLTHYCMIGNQPRMKAEGKSDGNKVAFKFVSATNMKSDKDMHMHDVVFTFIDQDTLKTEWTNYNDGKPAGTAVFNLKRKK
jgi:hypothetical protein